MLPQQGPRGLRDGPVPLAGGSQRQGRERARRVVGWRSACTTRSHDSSHRPAGGRSALLRSNRPCIPAEASAGTRLSGEPCGACVLRASTPRPPPGLTRVPSHKQHVCPEPINEGGPAGGPETARAPPRPGTPAPLRQAPCVPAGPHVRLRDTRSPWGTACAPAPATPATPHPCPGNQVPSSCLRSQFRPYRVLERRPGVCCCPLNPRPRSQMDGENFSGRRPDSECHHGHLNRLLLTAGTTGREPPSVGCHFRLKLPRPPGRRLGGRRNRGDRGRLQGGRAPRPRDAIRQQGRSRHSGPRPRAPSTRGLRAALPPAPDTEQRPACCTSVGTPLSHREGPRRGPGRGDRRRTPRPGALGSSALQSREAGQLAPSTASPPWQCHPNGSVTPTAASPPQRRHPHGGVPLPTPAARAGVLGVSPASPAPGTRDPTLPPGSMAPYVTPARTPTDETTFT